MADIDILNIEPNKISRDLKGKYVLIYGDPKSGKTTLASQFPKSLLCAFEIGYHALPGIKAVDITKWSDFKRVCKQLKTEEARATYDTVIVDTIGIAIDMCEKYILSVNSVDSLSEVAWG